MKRNTNIYLSPRSQERLKKVAALLNCYAKNEANATQSRCIEWVLETIPIDDLLAAAATGHAPNHQEQRNEEATPAEPSAHNGDLVPAARRKRDKAKRPKAPQE